MQLNPMYVWSIVVVMVFAIGCSEDEEASNPTATSNATTATSNGTTSTSNGTTATSNGTTATSNGTTATSNGTSDVPVPAEAMTVELGEFRVAVDPAQGALRFEDGDGRVLLETLGRDAMAESPEDDRLGGYAPLAFRHTDVDVLNIAGAFEFNRGEQPWSPMTTVTRINVVEHGVQLHFQALGSPEVIVTLRLDEKDNLVVYFQAPEAPEGLETLTSMAFACDEDTRFYGLGSQSYAAQHRGMRVPIWPQEQGIGKPPEVAAPVFGFNGRAEDAYAPMGWMMSSQGAGVLLGSSARSVFELCSERDDSWRLETYASEFSFVLLSGGYKALLEGLTEYTGRAKEPVPWTFAPWNDIARGPERVRGLAQMLRENGIPSSVLWVEDWIGGEDEGITGYHLNYKWSADRELYPDLPDMLDELHDQGFKFLGYFNSFIRMESNLWQEGVDGDFLIKREDGSVYTFVDPIFKEASLADLTNPATLEWLRGYQLAAVELGLDGWMADFAEWLPADAVLYDGRRGFEVHNLYPLMWQQANLDNLTEAHDDGDFVFFARSGFAWNGGGTQGLAPVMWAGDQNTSWDEGDGIKSVIPIGLNLGMSGVGIFAHDIAGYISVITPPSTKELFFRWTELGAFSPVMRTHHGAADELNWSLDKDEETLAHWKRYAIEHTLLFPYLMSLGHHASATGVPMFRHMVLEFPDDPDVADLSRQYMLGDALLVAPVMDEGATRQELYLPEGDWASWWSGAVLSGPGRHIVDAPLGEIPVYVRPGGIVPRLTEVPDTLTSGGEGVKTLEDVGDSLEVVIHPGAVRTFVMHDGTRFELTSEALPSSVSAESMTVDGEQVVACVDEASGNCFDAPTNVLRWVGEAFSVAVDGGPSLTISGTMRVYMLRWL